MISFCGISWGILAFIFLSYLIPHIVVSMLRPKDLKKKYNAKWALVTGSSSGKRPLSIFHAFVHQKLNLLLQNSYRSDRLISCRVGIGKSLASKLAEQGLNVVLVALQDGLLDATLAELQAQFPKQSFRKVLALAWIPPDSGTHSRHILMNIFT
jgi:hypothetical protein